MDEQTTLQATSQPSNYDISADGAVNAGYDEEALETSQAETPETPAEPEELPPDGVRLKDDGEIEFGEQFFGEMKDEPEEAPEQAEPKAPKYYTDEELDRIPFTQWDLSRLNGDVGKYALHVQRQLQRQQEYARTQAMQSQPLPPDIVEPKAYTHKELSEDALKLACEKLGIEDADDFDSYENEHRAAFELAMQELNQKRNAEITSYQNVLRSWNENIKYQYELTQRPDYNEFFQWYMNECQKSGYTLPQIENELYNIVKQNGNNFGVVKQVVEGWYQIFRQQRSASNPRASMTSQRPSTNTVLPPQGIRRVPRTSPPPVLESTRGNNYAVKPPIRAEAFAGMTSDEQANALIQLGLV